jgi:acyl carrier protein
MMVLDGRLVESICRNFGLAPEQVTPETSADTVADWDSVGHLKLILDIEETFAVRFSAAELLKLNSAAGIQAALDRRAAG